MKWREASGNGLWWCAGLLACGWFLACGWVVVDAARQRARRDGAGAEVRAVVRLLGSADLALSSASRWLRHPSLTEPGAPFADGPAILDADPAGAMMAPPGAVLGGTRTRP